MWAGLAGLLSTGLATAAARALAMKIFLRLLLITLVPLLTLMAFNTILGVIVDYVITEVDAVNAGTTTGFNFPAVFLFLYTSIGLDVAIGALVGALSTKLLLRSIPFVRL